MYRDREWWRMRQREEERKNRENGVMGVPTYVINNGITLTGSQPVDSLVKLLKHINSN